MAAQREHLAASQPLNGIAILNKGCRTVSSCGSWESQCAAYPPPKIGHSPGFPTDHHISGRKLSMTSQVTCDYPDKSIATGFELRNSTLAGPDSAGSACCTAGDICTTGGYCLNNQYYPYRGACTDKSWNSGNCASECLDGESFSSVL